MKLLEPYKLGDLELSNRVVMAPMTRNRSPQTVLSDWAVEHYSARASAGLLLTEATQVSARGQSTFGTPGLHTDQQQDAWKAVVDAVHAAGGKIAVQLAHAGRLTHSDFHTLRPVAPSAVVPPGLVRTPAGTKVYESPWVPQESEVANLVDEFSRAARRAREIGFDGVEIHGAHGFLIDQFLQSATNLRDDKYGGSAGNRRRFALEIVQAIAQSWPLSRVGFTVSPGGSHKGIHDADPVATFTALARDLSARGLGWLHVADLPLGDLRPSEFLRPVFKGTLIVSEGYTLALAEEALDRDHADLVAFGRAFTSNPDLVERIRLGQPWRVADSKTFYSPGPEGYVATVL